MSTRYGPHSEAVAAFFDEVRSTDKAVWRRYAETALPSRALVAAGRALDEVLLSAPVRSALYSEALAAFRTLGVADDDLPEGVYVSRVAGGIQNAATALASGDDLDDVHRRVLLAPFAELGFVAAARALASPAPDQ